MRFHRSLSLVGFTLILAGLSACQSSQSVSASEEVTDDNDIDDNDLIEVHAHVDLNDAAFDATMLVSAMGDNSVTAMFLMPTPGALLDNSPDSEDILGAFTSTSTFFRYLYGGKELNPLLHATGRPTAFTEDEVYPNGTGGMDVATALDLMNDIAADPDTWRTEFEGRASAAAASGQYVGFGELAPEHYSLHEGHPDISYPPDHEWLLWLSDLAAEYGMFLDVHFEADEDTISGFENLLSHNRATNVIWDHAGWTNTGYVTADRLRTCMAANPNLYLSLKLREPRNTENSQGFPLQSDGTIKAEWASLLTDYSDRILIGTDSKFWQDGDGDGVPAESIPQRVSTVELLLSQIPEDAATNIRSETARALFAIP